MHYHIRQATKQDYFAVEQLTREAFWNLHQPGCDEHYLVHIMRDHPDFIPELALVATSGQQIIGNIMYTKARLVDENQQIKEILTFGPLSVLPDFQRQGIGKALLETSFKQAKALGYDTIVIFGHPGNYVTAGFKSCLKYHVCLENGQYPVALLVKELVPGCLDGRQWIYHESAVYDISSKEAERFDQQFEPKTKAEKPSQEEFYIYCHGILNE